MTTRIKKQRRKLFWTGLIFLTGAFMLALLSTFILFFQPYFSKDDASLSKGYILYLTLPLIILLLVPGIVMLIWAWARPNPKSPIMSLQRYLGNWSIPLTVSAFFSILSTNLKNLNEMSFSHWLGLAVSGLAIFFAFQSNRKVLMILVCSIIGASIVFSLLVN